MKDEGTAVRSLAIRFGQILVAVVLASLAAVTALRFLHPPVTLFMLHAWGSALWERRPFELDYRWRSLDEIAPSVGRAVVAAEDQRFRAHWGFDLDAIGKAWNANARGRRLRGASTITQQVAKNLFLWPGRTWVRKGLEAYWTVLIEFLWPKRRILEMYLNIVELGDGVYGFEAASQRYFGKPASRLTDHEAALLAAGLPQPRRLRPAQPSLGLRRRAAWIERQMKNIPSR